MNVNVLWILIIYLLIVLCYKIVIEIASLFGTPALYPHLLSIFLPQGSLYMYTQLLIVDTSSATHTHLLHPLKEKDHYGVREIIWVVKI